MREGVTPQAPPLPIAVFLTTISRQRERFSSTSDICFMVVRIRTPYTGTPDAYHLAWLWGEGGGGVCNEILSMAWTEGGTPMGHHPRGIIRYIEYQSVCPFVGFGSPHPLTRKRVELPPRSQLGGYTHFLAGKRNGGPNADEGTDTLVLYVYYI